MPCSTKGGSNDEEAVSHRGLVLASSTFAAAEDYPPELEKLMKIMLCNPSATNLYKQLMAEYPQDQRWAIGKKLSAQIEEQGEAKFCEVKKR